MEKIKQNLLIISSIVLVLAGLWLVALIRNSNKQYSYIGVNPNVRPSLTVTGEGKMVIKPDVATMSFGLTTQNNVLATGQKENTEKMNNFIKGLKKDFNVADKDVQTSNYQINPRYDWTSGKQTLVGYEVNQTVEVKVRNLEKLGDIIARAGQEQLNQIGGLQFTVDDLEKVKKEAREKAFAQAKLKAQELAKASGVKLGKVLSVQESNPYNPAPIGLYRADSMMKESAAVAAPTIEVGSNEVTVNATIEYEIL